jgi:alkanesulfonate monooxygenase SsuD/methylene tetrahydromethanopterin reductase-like flavin-dependent oxidoreductase (luciferase family)
MVAKMAQTLDNLSDGRLILGLGGGYSDDEFRAFGLDVPSAAEKVSGLADAVTIARGLWTTGSFTYLGKRYHTDAATIEPKPPKPIPIWLGTFGPRALEVTGRLADGWIPSHGYMPADRVPSMRDRIFDAALAAGRDTSEITLAYNLEVHVTEEAALDKTVFEGPADAVAERMLPYLDMGFSTFNFIPPSNRRLEQAELIAAELLPRLRSAIA